MGVEEKRGCLQKFKAQFSLRCLGLTHDNPSLFVNAQCFKPVIYLIWSGFWATFFFAMLMLDIYYNKDMGAEYLSFLTNLTYIVQTAFVLLDFIVTFYVYFARKDIRNGYQDNMEWYLKLQWLLFNVTNTASLLVTLFYYVLLTPIFNHQSVNKHLLNSVYTMLNIIICAKPVNILHFYQPMLYAAAYILFSVIYHFAGADPVYDPLDWSNPGKTGIVLSLTLFVVVPVLHVLVFFTFYTARVFLYQACCMSRGRPEPEEEYHGVINYGTTGSHTSLSNSKY